MVVNQWINQWFQSMFPLVLFIYLFRCITLHYNVIYTYNNNNNNNIIIIILCIYIVTACALSLFVSIIQSVCFMFHIQLEIAYFQVNTNEWTIRNMLPHIICINLRMVVNMCMKGFFSYYYYFYYYIRVQLAIALNFVVLSYNFDYWCWAFYFTYLYHIFQLCSDVQIVFILRRQAYYIIIIIYIYCN